MVLDGYNKAGYDVNGFDRDGMHQNGTMFDNEGYDVNGLDIDGYDRAGLKGGFNKDGIYVATGKPYNPQGYDANGEYWRDNGGYDFQGWNEAGWNRDGINKVTGKPHDTNGNKENGDRWYDNESYDYEGYTAAGWNKAGDHRDTGKPHDTDGNDINGDKWYDADGYDYQGLDVNGFAKLEPVAAAVMYPNSSIISQSRAGTAIDWARGLLEQNADNVKTQFSAHGGSNPAFRDIVMAACDSSKIPGAIPETGDSIVNNGISAISRYIVEIAQAFPLGEERDNFNLIMDAFRTRAYVDARSIKVNDPTDNPSQAELTQLYIELAAAGVNVNAANFDQELNNTIIPNLSATLNINPGLVRTLLNQITTFERAFASVDDIRALGYDPTMNNLGRPYAQQFPIRNLSYIHSLLAGHEVNLTQSQQTLNQ